MSGGWEPLSSPSPYHRGSGIRGGPPSPLPPPPRCSFHPNAALGCVSVGMASVRGGRAKRVTAALRRLLWLLPQRQLGSMQVSVRCVKRSSALYWTAHAAALAVQKSRSSEENTAAARQQHESLVKTCFQNQKALENWVQSEKVWVRFLWNVTLLLKIMSECTK